MDIADEKLYLITDALDQLSAETGHSVPQVALAWLLSRPTVSGIVIGARNADQLKDNLAAADLKLTSDHIRLLDQASDTPLIYPYWHQRATSARRNPSPTP